jgi:hypothetical protein
MVSIETKLTHKTRAEQEEALAALQVSMASREATVAAAALFYCLWGTDLLKDLWVRTSAPGVALRFSRLGVFEFNCDDNQSDGNVVCAAAPAPHSWTYRPWSPARAEVSDPETGKENP